MRVRLIAPTVGLFLVLLGVPALAPREAAAATNPVCRQGSNQVRTMSIWYVQNGVATTTRWAKRPFIVHLPPSYDGTVPFPVVIDLHGGAGSIGAARVTTCPNGDLNDPGCLDRVADCEGFITVYPSGTANMMFPNARTFSAGGGAGGYECVSGFACDTKVDDLRYFTDLLDTLEKIYTIDPARIYMTGHSNGAAMAQRLACELSDRIAAIAPIAGGNQFAALDYCSPVRPVPVLEIHGTDDRCWPYLGGPQTCLGRLSSRVYVPIPATVAAWAARNGCQPAPRVENLPDVDRTDGTTVTRIAYQQCANGGDVVHLRVNGGGHTWPGGSAVLPSPIVGKVSREFSANRMMWEFFKAHPMR
jgi:polyhydroxybutyrate depolymerase